MNTHVIDPAQLFVATLTGTEGAEFLNVFRNRTDRNMFQKYAEIISKFQFDHLSVNPVCRRAEKSFARRDAYFSPDLLSDEDF